MLTERNEFSAMPVSIISVTHDKTRLLIDHVRLLGYAQACQQLCDMNISNPELNECQYGRISCKSQEMSAEFLVAEKGNTYSIKVGTSLLM